jgi:hypothetical protein
VGNFPRGPRGCRRPTRCAGEPTSYPWCPRFFSEPPIFSWIRRLRPPSATCSRVAAGNEGDGFEPMRCRGVAHDAEEWHDLAMESWEAPGELPLSSMSRRTKSWLPPPHKRSLRRGVRREERGRRMGTWAEERREGWGSGCFAWVGRNSLDLDSPFDICEKRMRDDRTIMTLISYI